jgi:type I restriction enzyme, S subunit
MLDWKEIKLGDVISLEYGKGLKNYRSGQGKYEVFGTNGKIGFTDDYLYNQPSIIIGRKGAYRGVHLAQNPFYVIDTAFYTKNKIEDLFVLYLYYWLKNVDINAMDSGSAIPSTSRDEVYDLDFFLPEIDEQKAIASVLSSLDDKIDLLHRQNKTLEAIAETLFRQWFVEEAKDDWEERKIPDEFECVMGTSPPGSSYNENGIGSPMFQGNADFTFRFPRKRVFTTEPKRFAEKYDTLISVRAPVGAQNMATERCCIGRGVAAFRHAINKSFYTYTYFKMRSLIDNIKQYNETGTVFGAISKADFEKLEISIPPKELIENFQIHAKPLDDRVISNCFQIRTLEKLRDTLLPNLMSGEVRLAL